MPLVLCALTLYLAAQSVTGLTDPRPASLVVDQAGVIDDATEARIDAVLLALRRDRGTEVALVTVDDVDGATKAFATALYNHWQLGSAANSDGVLVLMVMGQRRLEIETGDGMQTSLPSWWLADMQKDTMVPRFKAKDIAGGLELGIAAIDERLRALPGEGERDVKPGEYRSDGTLVDNGTGTAAGGTAPVGVMPPEPPPSTPPPPSANEPSTAEYVVGGGVAAGAVGGGGVLAVFLARRRRQCSKCKIKMLPLDEVADDAHLDAGQRTEERIGSVNYEVLICARCQASRTLRHSKWFSGRSRCSACGYKTEKSTSVTLVQATYDSGGSVQVTEDCANCNRHYTYTRSTARLTRPSSSSSSSSSGGSSWSSSSSSSSHSSGGHSSGGGAGSSW
jgi:uncharacterized protein